VYNAETGPFLKAHPCVFIFCYSIKLNIFIFVKKERCNVMKKVAIVMGSDSDLGVMEKAAKKLESFGVEYEMRIMSAHRTPAAASEFSANAKANGFGVIIAAAGKAAHLGGVLAAHTTLPVIGVPIKSSTLDGLDALLSTVQMPSGIPVATVAIDGAENAAILAVQMLALSDEGLAEKVCQMKIDMENAVLEKDRKLNNK
jgi:5-(carboxyamino)imidazole ribonucleotide mutase